MFVYQLTIALGAMYLSGSLGGGGGHSVQKRVPIDFSLEVFGCEESHNPAIFKFDARILHFQCDCCSFRMGRQLPPGGF